MSLYQEDITRLFQVYIVQGIVGVFFLFLAYKILKRDTKKLNVIFSLFYIGGVIGVILDFLIPPLTIESIILTLYYLSVFFFLLSPIFLLIVELILIKSEKIINTKIQLSIIGTYGVLLACMIFIPNGANINASTNWRPVLSVFFLIYTLTILTIGATIPSLYCSVIIYKNFEDPKIKKKWQYFIIGLCGLFILVYGTLISNMINIKEIRIIWSIISLILAIFPSYFVYYGIGKQIEK